MKKCYSLCYLLLFFFSVLSCQPKDKFGWNAGWSAPKYYGAAPFIEYFYKGQSIAGASANIGADPGWGITSGGYTGGDIYKEVPDSIHLKWLCSTDGYYYEGGSRLPREKMIKLFKEKTIDAYTGAKADYSLVVAGMAPGGNVTIWMQGATTNKEIIKFKVANKGVWMENNQEYQKGEKETAMSKDFINSEANIFRNLHGIPYSVWEKGEKEYNYDIGFSSENKTIEPNIITIYSKDGSFFQPDISKTSMRSVEMEDWSKFNYLKNNNEIKKSNLPVQIDVEWRYDKKYYNTSIILPIDFGKYFSKYKYDRILIGVAKDNTNGNIWVEGKQGRLKIMNFKVFKANKNEMGSYISGGYSLPKGFVFPKWEGREKLTFPEVDYWQEK